jgi:hypothetical protein
MELRVLTGSTHFDDPPAQVLAPPEKSSEIFKTALEYSQENDGVNSGLHTRELPSEHDTLQAVSRRNHGVEGLQGGDVI